MSFRRSAALALAAAALLSGCKKVSQEASPQQLVIAAFNSPVCVGTATQCPAVVPTPNDLALQAVPTLPAGAQKALLQAFVDQGGFPSDQAVGITIPLKQLQLDGASGNYALVTPPLVDRATLVSGTTYVVVKIDVDPPVLQAVEVDAANCTTGQIALRNAANVVGSRAWLPGRYAFAISTGVRTTTGLSVSADQGIALAIPNKDVTNPNNQPPGGLPPALAGQVDAVRKSLWNPVDWNSVGGLWKPSAPGVVGAFPAVARYIPAEQVAAIGTFEIAGAPIPGLPIVTPVPTVPVDSASGIAPLPVDLLRTGPPAITGAQTIAFNPAFGPAAQGLTTLDGFSTTAMVFAPTSIPVDAATVNACNVHLFRLDPGGPTLLTEFKREAGASAAAGCLPTPASPATAAYVIEPDALTTTNGNFLAPGVPCAAATCSLLIGLQPAVRITGTNFTLPPLDEGTDYAVVVTTSVRDMLGRPLVKSTAGKLLTSPGFDPIATSSVNGKSLLVGIDDTTATALQKMRQQLVPVLAAFSTATGKTAADVAMAYTFRTQTVKATARSIVGLPYNPAFPSAVVADPDAVTSFTPTLAGALWGFDPTLLTTFASVAEIDEVKFTSRNLLLTATGTGGFEPNGVTTQEKIKALVAVPNPAAVTGTCPDPTGLGGVAYTAAKCAPLVVYAHGLQSSKAEMLPIAAALTARGFVVVAIDAEKHGERSLCTADSQCCPGGACGPVSKCNFYPNLRTPVDAAPLGYCESSPGVRGAYVNYRLDCAAPFTGVDASGNPIPNLACLSAKGTPFVSAGKGFLSLNFFRVRDSLRQDIIDTSAVVKALAPIGKSTDAFAAALEAQYGLAVDYTKVYFIGHSYGAIGGTLSLAVNPRLSRAVQVAGGATAIDVFANPDSHYHSVLVNLLAQGGIAPGTPDYLKTLQIGKWILDPADPANYAQYVTGSVRPILSTIPATLSGIFPIASREVLTQLSLCDGTVPNDQNVYLAAQLGLTLPSTPGTTSSGRVQWYMQTGAAQCPADAASHSNLIDFTTPSLTAQAQSSAGGFLADPGAIFATPVLAIP